MASAEAETLIEDKCAAVYLHAGELLALRLGGLVAILVAGSVGVALPFFTNVARLHNVLFLMRAFAGGVVVATGARFWLQGTLCACYFRPMNPRR